MPSCAADGGEPLAAHPSRQHGSADPLPVLLCGYYGEHNLGDDALLEALLQLLPAGVTPLVTAFDEAQVRERFGVATVQRATTVPASGLWNGLGKGRGHGATRDYSSDV